MYVWHLYFVFCLNRSCLDTEVSQNKKEKRKVDLWYNTLMKDAARNEYKTFYNWTRMNPTAFNNLADLLSKSRLVNKQTTWIRDFISVGKHHQALWINFITTSCTFLLFLIWFFLNFSTAMGTFRFFFKILGNWV